MEEGWHNGIIVVLNNEEPVSHVLELVSVRGSQLGHIAHSRHKLQPVRSFEWLRNKSGVHHQTQEVPSRQGNYTMSLTLLPKSHNLQCKVRFQAGFHEEE